MHSFCWLELSYMYILFNRLCRLCLCYGTFLSFSSASCTLHCCLFYAFCRFPFCTDFAFFFLYALLHFHFFTHFRIFLPVHKFSCRVCVLPDFRSPIFSCISYFFVVIIFFPPLCFSASDFDASFKFPSPPFPFPCHRQPYSTSYNGNIVFPLTHLPAVAACMRSAIVAM